MAKVDLRHRPPQVGDLYGGRLRVRRIADVLNFLDDRAKIEADVFLDPKTPDEKFPDCVIVDQQLTGADTGKPNQVVWIFETLTATFVDEVPPIKRVGEDGRSVFERVLVALPDADASGIITGADYLGTHVLSTYVDESTEFVKRFRATYIQATNTPAQIGDVVAEQADAKAYVGTDNNGKLTTSTRFARKWRVQYVVSGDGTVGDTHWLAVSAVRAFGARTGYFTGSSIVRRGTGYSIIARVYHEIPDTYAYPRAERYFFPGTLGVSNGMPVGSSGATRQTTADVEETYHLGEVAPQAIEFEVISWASGLVNFTTTNDVDGAKAFSFNGCIGSLFISASNVMFAGYECDTVAGSIASIPGAYPVGKKRIASIVDQWEGDIWKRVNVYITF